MKDFFSTMIFLFGYFLRSSNAFLSPFSQPFRNHYTTEPASLHTQRITYLRASPSDVFVLSYDGVIADTKQWRSNLAISAALNTWPQLAKHNLIGATGDQNRDWLINKLSALSDVTVTGEDGMMGCDAVLLARVLLEEQLLDEGRSNGCRGKYGSKFHPSSDSEEKQQQKEQQQQHQQNQHQQEGGSVQGSRPLTVGEIASNWNDGACLKDTVRIKYNVDRKDPIPIIREEIKALLEDAENSLIGPLPEIFPTMSDALLDCNCPVYILVGDESHVPIAMSSLSFLSIPMQSIHWNEETNDYAHSKKDKEHGITIVPPGEGGRGHTGVLQHILMSVPEDSSIHVIHSDVSTLQKAKALFGDNRPRPGMFAKSAIAEASLKLSLPTMSSGPQQQNDAEMDPWLNLIDGFDIVETLSARVVTEERM